MLHAMLSADTQPLAHDEDGAAVYKKYE